MIKIQLTDRIISPTETPRDQGVNWALSPETLDEYVGQRELIDIELTLTNAEGLRIDASRRILLGGAL